MHEIQGAAWRVKSGIAVQLSGLLANTCMRACIADKYPGGNIVHIVDPGNAEVYVNEWSIAGSPFDFCLPILVPWCEGVLIPTSDYDSVKVYVNNEETLELKIQETGKELQSLDILPWKVIALVGTNPDDKPPFKCCAIIPSHAFFPGIYRVVFGPKKTRQECEEFVKKNCEELASA